MSDPAGIPSAAERAAWLARAAALLPAMPTTVVHPTRLVEPQPDASAWQGWRMQPLGPVEALAGRQLRRGDVVHLDLGAYHVGRIELDLASAGMPMDAPLRLRVRLSEMPATVGEADVPTASTMGMGWNQDETLTIDELPATVLLPRRVAGRWLTLTCVDTTPIYQLVVRAVRFHATVPRGTPIPAPAALTPRQADIDRIAVATLHHCMQTVFEDGPRRDRRLWTGDLRLQLLAAGAACPDLALAERSLCLLAAFTRPSDGAFPACIFERPEPHSADTYISDYCLALPAILRELLRQGGDRALVRGLAALARRQITIGLGWLDQHGVASPPTGWWTFIDWQDALDRRAPLHGVLCWALDAWIALADELGHDAAPDRVQLASLRAAGLAAFGDGRQDSWAAAAWLILGGVLTPQLAGPALLATMADPASVRPGGPYMVHHVVHALFMAGERQRGLDLIESYWGGMLDRGADACWEVYVPEEPRRSPYGDHRVNSACHAWGCTPTWFLRNPERAALPS